MKALFSSICLFVCLISIKCEVLEYTAYDYHNRYGIRRAEEIRQIEEQYFASTNRIVGGEIAPEGLIPYQAGLIISLNGITGNSVCGASIISSNRLLTAAHCWSDGVRLAWRFNVVVGSLALFLGTDGFRVLTTTVFVHPDWTPSDISNDVAVIALPYNIPFSATIQPMKLPSINGLNQTFESYTALASGFGRTLDSQTGVSSSTVVSMVELTVISNAQCRQVFSIVKDSTICTSGTGGVGVCGGDSGGPLVVTYRGERILVGVTSFVAAAGCQMGFPSAFARVTSFLDWIYLYL